VKQARSLLDPQLALEAAALMRGAFRDAGTPTPEDLIRADRER
jgi:ATP-dependent helicase/nuclease subunit B